MNSAISVELREFGHVTKRAIQECQEKRYRNLMALALGSARKSGIRLTGQRAFHGFCVGAPRTGTTTTAGFLRDYYRARHEVDSEEVLEICFDHLEGKVSDERLLDFISDRDRRLYLEMDSSSHNYYLVPFLVEIFPKAKFLMPIREPRSWLNSYIYYGVNYRARIRKTGKKKAMPQRVRMDKFRYGSLINKYSPGEEPLEELGMPSIEAFLKFYRDHYVNLLKWIPESRRMIYNSREFDNNVERICEFLGADIARLTFSNTHMNKTNKENRILEQIDKIYLEDMIQKYCGELKYLL